MNQQNHQTNNQNDRITDQQTYQRINNLDFFSFPKFEEQHFYCPQMDSFYPFYSTNLNTNLTLLQSQLHYPQYSQSYPLSQAASTYPFLGGSFFSPSIDQIPQYQKTYCHTRPSNDDDSKVEAGIHQRSNSKIENLQISVKQQQLKIQEKEVTIQSLYQKGVNSTIFMKKSLNCQPSINEIVDSITRKERVNRYLLKKQRRTFEKRIVYQCRKSVADNRLRVKGRFVKRVQSQVLEKFAQIRQIAEQ